MIEFQTNEKKASLLSAAAKSVKVLTKRLKLQSVRKDSDAKKLVVSTSFLPLFDFVKGARVVEEVLGQGAGMRVRLARADEPNTKAVYDRGYSNRAEREPLLDIRSQRKMREAFGESCEEVHIEFRKGEILITPVGAIVQDIRPVEAALALRADQNGLYSSICKVLDVVKQGKFARLSFNAAQFEDTAEFEYFTVQLRRIGYKLSKTDDGLMRAYFENVGVSELVQIDCDQIAFDKQGMREKAKQTMARVAELNVFGACTAGVDLYSARENGFKPLGALEFRPIEQRDMEALKDEFGRTVIDPVTGLTVKTGRLKNDKRESGLAVAAMNLPELTHLFNEDIFTFDIKRHADFFSNITFFHTSPCCVDFSSLKENEDKARAVENLATSKDMFQVIWELAKQYAFPTIMVENVTNYIRGKETAGLVLGRALEELGYKVYTHVVNGKNLNSYTERERVYITATLLDAPFQAPQAEKHTVNVWSDLVSKRTDELVHECSGYGMERVGRKNKLNLIEEGTAIAGCIPKAQGRANEALRIRVGEKFYFPEVPLLKAVNSIPESFNFDIVNKEVATEIVGNSIDFIAHGKFLSSIKAHIASYCKMAGVVLKSLEKKGAQVLPARSVAAAPCLQMSLF